MNASSERPEWRRGSSSHSELGWKATIETLQDLFGIQVKLFAPERGKRNSHVFVQGVLRELPPSDDDSATFAIGSGGLVLAKEEFVRADRHAADDDYFWVNIETERGRFSLQDEHSG